jgi:hypothetical protein
VLSCVSLDIAAYDTNSHRAAGLAGGPSEKLSDWFFGGPGKTRTCDLRFRKPLLYPAELRDRLVLISIYSIKAISTRARNPDVGAGLVAPRDASLSASAASAASAVVAAHALKQTHPCAI